LTVDDGTMTVHPGDVVKSLGGPITVKGGTLDASNSAPGTKLFTSLKDQTAYAQTCPSILTGLCASGPQQGDWGGIVITDDTSGQPGSASIANGQLSFAATALSIDSGPTASFGTTNLGLIVKGTTISDATSDGINAQDTPISVTTSTIQRVGHGILATFFGGTPCVSACGTSLDVEHVTVTTSSKDGIVASGLGGRHTIVSDNVISGAGTYGIRLSGADELTLNNNTVNSSGGPATTFRYPAIYLSGVKADFELIPGTSTVADNRGSGNGIDAMVIHGEATQPLTWLTTGVTAPVVVPAVPVDHFGYMLDGGLTVDGTMTTNLGDVVKVLGGAIQVNGSLVATGTTFTSLKDGSAPVKVCDAGFDSVFIQRVASSCPTPASGNWAGITASGGATLTSTTIGFDDGLTVTGGALQFAGGAMHDIARNAIVVTGSPVSVTNVVFSRIGNDGIDSTNSGSLDVITDNQFDHVGGVAINLQNSPADLERNVFTNDANPTVKTSGAPVSLQCSSIQSGGITGDAGLIVKESDFAFNVGVTAPAGASVENNWWGQGGGPNTSQLSGGVTVTTFFATQNPTATIAITGKPSTTQLLDPVKWNGSLGTGLVQATLTFSRNMNPEATLPSVSYASSPVSFTGAWKLNDPRTWIGTAPIDSTLAPNGTHTVSASGAHDCVPDVAHNLMTPLSTPNTFTADTTTLPTVSVGAPDLVGANSARLHGHIDPAGWATGAGQFVLTNLANPLDQHTYPAPAVADKTTPLDFMLVATGLSDSSTYLVQLQVPSVNGTATQPTFDTVTTTAPASKLVFTSSPPASIVAGAPFAAAVSAEDPLGNVVSDFAGGVTIALTPSTATLTGALTQPVVNGVASFSGLSVNKTGSYSLAATSSPVLTSTVSSSITILPGSATQVIVTTQPSSTATAGTAFGVTVTAEDALSNVATGYTGTVHFTSSDGLAVLPADYTFTSGGGSDNGVHAFAGGLTLKTAGSQSVTATDTVTSSIIGAATVTVNPDAAASLTVSAPASATAGSAFTVTVTAKDAFNNTATAYTGTVHFTSSDALASLPADGAVPGGSTTFAATLNTGGAQSLIATDTVSASITGSKGGIAVTPRTPIGVAAVANGTSEIDLSWTASPGATGYNVQRSATTGGPYTQLGSTPTTATTSYHDTGLSAGTSYYYVVQAVGTAGSSANSSEVSAATVAAAPSGLAVVTNGTSEIDLSWTASPGATGYNVQRSATTGGPYTQVGVTPTTATTSYHDTGLIAGTAYYYVVQAVDSGGTSTNSNEATATTVPAAPTGLTASANGTAAIDLSWAASSGATSYNVLRSTTSGGETILTSVTATAYHDTGLSAGTTYYYEVQAADSGGTSTNSNEANASTVPAAPTGLAATANGSAAIDLTWSASSGATSYNVLRSTTSGGETMLTSVSTTAYHDTGLSAGTTYYYEVQAVDGGGTSANSSEANATTVPAVPTGVGASATASKIQVDLSWTAVTGATGYNVQRSLSTGGPYSQVGGTPTTTGITFSDTTVAANTAYYYEVQAVGIGGTSGNSGEVTSTTVPAAPAGVAATVISSTEIDLSWAAVTGATGYDVLRGSVTGGPYTLLGTSPTTLTASFKDTTLSTGSTYFYVVAARSPSGPSPNSGEVSGTTP
jgi:parallel beta-helix repeat protein